MNFLNYLNKASKKLSDMFYQIEDKIPKQIKDLDENIYKINSQIWFWQNDNNYNDEAFFEYFTKYFKEKFMVYNLIKDRKIFIKKNLDKIVDFNDLSENNAYSLEFLISFAISTKNWLSISDKNILIIHDDIIKNDGKTFCLLSCIISFNFYNFPNLNKGNINPQPISIYADITNSCKLFQEIVSRSDCKNHLRYINYFDSIQKNPILTLKKFELKSVLICGAPAIDNLEDGGIGPYVTINKNSYYAPVIRIKSNGKYIYSSYIKGKDVDKIFYSDSSVAKFEIGKLIFNDICLEVLHKGNKSFKLLFTLQFNTLFIDENSIKFSRDQIDSVYKDIRYPNEFFIHLIFDNNKDEKLSTFDEESMRWKTLLSEMIMKGFKNKNNNKDNNKNENISKDLDKNNNNDKGGVKVEDLKGNDKKENIINEDNDKKDEIKKIINENDKKENDKEEDIILNNPNTMNQVNELLKEMEGKTDNKNEEEEEEENDEDIENYLKNLENKAK